MTYQTNFTQIKSRQMRSIFILLSGFSVLTTACVTTSKFKDMSSEISTLEQDKAKLSLAQDDILAPNEFAKFNKTLAAAKASNAAQKDSSESVAQARKLFDVMQEQSKPARVILSDVLVARRKALQAGGRTNSMFLEVDEDLSSDTQEAFSGDVSDIQSKREEYKNRYTNVEGDLIVSSTYKSQVLALNTFAS